MRRLLLLGVLLLLAAAPRVSAQDRSDDVTAPCRFIARDDGVLALVEDCVTDASIELTDGQTLDGQSHTIWAVDPAGGSFRGGVIVARGGAVSIRNTVVAARQLAGVCHSGDERLRGILFDEASGVIRQSAVLNLAQWGSACVEGNAIEIRSRRRDGRMVSVRVEDNLIDHYQKSGVVIHGAVDAVVTGNIIGTSAAQSLLAANSVQIGPGAVVRLERNLITGNSYKGDGVAGTAVLLVESGPGTTVVSNVIRGNADVGIHVLADDAVVSGNDLLDSGVDGAYDVGIVDAGSGNLIEDNAVRGFRLPYSGVQRPAAARQAVE